MARRSIKKLYYVLSFSNDIYEREQFRYKSKHKKLDRKIYVRLEHSKKLYIYRYTQQNKTNVIKVTTQDKTRVKKLYCPPVFFVLCA